MSKYPNVKCKHCGEEFESQIKIDPAIYAQVPNLKVGDNLFTCPKCDERASYSERDFIYTKSQAIELASFGKIVGAIVDVVDASSNPLKAATELLHEFEDAKSRNDPSLFQKSSKLAFLKKWIPNSPEKLAAYVVIGQLIVRLLTEQPDKPIDHKIIINQFNQIVAVQPLYKNESKVINKVGRNKKCPCGSGKKYKHCHGEIQ